MRNLIYAINLTIDGCCDHTQVGIPRDELYDYSIRLVQDARCVRLRTENVSIDGSLLARHRKEPFR